MTTTISPDLHAALKRLRLGRILDSLPERITLAEKDGTPFQDLLLALLVDEIARRQNNACCVSRDAGARQNAGVPDDSLAAARRGRRQMDSDGRC